MKNFVLPKKCLITMPDFIGDNIILLPFLSSLKANMSESSELCILSSSNMTEFFEDFDFIDKIFDKKIYKNNAFDFLQLSDFDTIIVLDFSLNWSLAAYMNQIPQRVIPDLVRSGLKDSRFLKKFFTHVTENTAITAKTSQKEVYLNFLKQLNLKVSDKSFSHPPIICKNPQKIESPAVFFHTSASFFSKKWPLKKWYNIIKVLAKNFNIYRIGEKNSSEDFYFSDLNVHDLRGKLSIKQTIDSLSKAKLLITTDSAPAHLGAFAGAENIIIIYGPTNHLQWKPESSRSNIIQIFQDLPCRPCQMRFCPNLRCIKEIQEKSVLDRIKSIPEFSQFLSACDLFDKE